MLGKASGDSDLKDGSVLIEAMGAGRIAGEGAGEGSGEV